MLRLELPGKNRRASGDWNPAALGSDISGAEVERIRAAIRSHAPPGPCPQCGTGLRAERTDRGQVDGHTVWAVLCPICDFHLNLRVFENAGPRVPTFTTLVGSRPPPHRWRRFATQSAGSAAFHAALIYAAILLTGGAMATVQSGTDTSMVFLTMEERVEPDQPEPEDPPETVVTLAAPPPKGFLTVDVPLEMPAEIPPIDLTQRFDPRDYSGIGQEGGIFTGVEGGLGDVPTTVADFGRAYLEAAVDEPPEVLTHPPLRYPELLRMAGIEGAVYLEFVVDTAGRAEANTIEVLRSDERAFEGPAIAMLRGSVFRPGRVRGRTVRVLVRMEVGFRLLRRF
jgi:TonB family protein